MEEESKIRLTSIIAGLFDHLHIKESLRETNQLSIDFPSLANKFLEKFYINFIKQEFIIPVMGMVTLKLL